MIPHIAHYPNRTAAGSAEKPNNGFCHTAPVQQILPQDVYSRSTPPAFGAEAHVVKSQFGFPMASSGEYHYYLKLVSSIAAGNLIITHNLLTSSNNNLRELILSNGVGARAFESFIQKKFYSGDIFKPSSRLAALVALGMGLKKTDLDSQITQWGVDQRPTSKTYQEILDRVNQRPLISLDDSLTPKIGAYAALAHVALLNYMRVYSDNYFLDQKNRESNPNKFMGLVKYYNKYINEVCFLYRFPQNLYQFIVQGILDTTVGQKKNLLVDFIPDDHWENTVDRFNYIFKEMDQQGQKSVRNTLYQHYQSYVYDMSGKRNGGYIVTGLHLNPQIRLYQIEDYQKIGEGIGCISQFLNDLGDCDLSDNADKSRGKIDADAFADLQTGTFTGPVIDLLLGLNKKDRPQFLTSVQTLIDYRDAVLNDENETAEDLREKVRQAREFLREQLVKTGTLQRQYDRILMLSKAVQEKADQLRQGQNDEIANLLIRMAEVSTENRIVRKFQLVNQTSQLTEGNIQNFWGYFPQAFRRYFRGWDW